MAGLPRGVNRPPAGEISPATSTRWRAARRAARRPRPTAARPARYAQLLAPKGFSPGPRRTTLVMIG